MNKLVIIFVALILALNACKSKRVISTVEPLAPLSGSELFQRAQNSQGDFNHLFYKKALVSYEDGEQSISFRTNIYLEKDSVIIMSVIPAFGMEFLRIKCTPSGVELLDRRNREHIIADYDELYKRLFIHTNYGMIQNIFTNRLFTYPVDNSFSNYQSQTTPRQQEYLLTSEVKRTYKKPFQPGVNYENVFHQIKMKPADFRVLTNTMLHTGLGLKMNLNYSEFKNSGEAGLVLPHKISINTGKLDKNYVVTIEVMDVEVDGPGKISFKVPDKYETIYR